MKDEFRLFQEETEEIMGPKPRINLENRGKLLALSQEGYTQREIAARVGCSEGSVSDILKKQRLTGSVNDAQIPGRRRKTSEREDRIIVRKSKSNHFKTAQEIKVEMQNEHALSVSVSTTKEGLGRLVLKGTSPEKNTPYCSP